MQSTNIIRIHFHKASKISGTLTHDGPTPETTLLTTHTTSLRFCQGLAQPGIAHSVGCDVPALEPTLSSAAEGNLVRKLPGRGRLAHVPAACSQLSAHTSHSLLRGDPRTSASVVLPRGVQGLQQGNRPLHPRTEPSLCTSSAIRLREKLVGLLWVFILLCIFK